MTKFRLVLLTALLSVAACECRPQPPTTGVTPEVEAATSGLSVEGCPVVDAAGNPVDGAVPIEDKVTVTNVGAAAATLAVTLEGAGAAQFKIGEFDPNLSPDNEVDIPVIFTPTAAGAVSALMKIDDGSPDTDILEVALSGNALSLPPQPTLKISVETAPGSGVFEPCAEGFTCSIDYPAVFFEQSVTQRVQLENTGCPALKVSEIRIDKGIIGDNLAFFLDSPATPPTELSPILLNVADGTEKIELAVRFSPVSDDPTIDERRAVLTVTTNDPNPKAENGPLNLSGTALRPAFSASPTFCNYTSVDDECGNDPRQAGVATFTVTNDGNVDITINEARLLNGGQNGRFALASDPVGTTIAANGGTHTFSVNYVDSNVYVQDFLVLSATAGGMPAGVLQLALAGGTPPRINVDLEPIAFADAGTGATRTFNIVAQADAGVLTISDVTVDQLSAGTANPFFAVTDKPAAGTTVQPGASVPVTVTYTRPASGGSQEGTLRVASNDPGYPAPDHRQVRLYSEGPPDFPPNAVLTGGPSAQDTSMALSVSEIQSMGNKLAISGSGSFDVDAQSNQVPVTRYKFNLVRKATGANSVIEDSTGLSVNGVVQGEGDIVLNFIPMGGSVINGTYQVNLDVFDDVGNKSQTAKLTILITL